MNFFFFYGSSKVMVTFVLMLLCGAFTVDQLTRIVECAQHCAQQQNGNLRLAQGEMCANPLERSLHGEHAHEMCTKAERDSKIPIASCAAQRYWNRSGVYSVLDTFISSPLMMLCVIVPTILYTIHQWFQDRRMKMQMQQTNEMQRNVLSTLEILNKSHNIPKPPPRPLPHSSSSVRSLRTHRHHPRYVEQYVDL